MKGKQESPSGGPRIPRWMIIAGIAVILALLLLNPAGRSLVIFLLPLGRGIDDFAVLALLVIGGIIAAPKLPGLAARIYRWIYSDDEGN